MVQFLSRLDMYKVGWRNEVFPNAYARIGKNLTGDYHYGVGGTES